MARPVPRSTSGVDGGGCCLGIALCVLVALGYLAWGIARSLGAGQ